MSRTLLHFAQDSDTSGFFPQLARWHDRDRYRMIFGTLYPTAPWLKEMMASYGVSTFSTRCHGRLAFPLATLRLARFLRAERVHILHTHLFEPSIVGLAAGVLARSECRVVTRHHSDYHTRIHKTWHVRVDKLCTRLSDRVVAVSKHTAQHLVEAEGAPPEKIRVVLHGIDFERVRPSRPDARVRMREQEGLGDRFVLLIAARLHPEKGYGYLFDSLPLVKARIKRPLTLLVAGRGSFEAEYRQQVRRLGCEDVVRFLGFRRDLPDLMLASDLVVLPSVAEAFGLVLVEALYLGLPVVATRVGGIPEIVEDGVDGILVPPADSQALATAIGGLVDDQKERSRLAEASRAAPLARFQFERMVREYEAVYDEFAASQAHRRPRTSTRQS